MCIHRNTPTNTKNNTNKPHNTHQTPYKSYVNIFNSHAVGMAVSQLLDFEIDFARNPISGSAAWFFVIILKFIMTAIFELKNHLKNSLAPKQISFSKLDFYKPIHLEISRRVSSSPAIDTLLLFQKGSD